uniref:Uncharacterized protein n=1 Tax=Vitis vinifera TaxID=29760 RepID=F6HZB2_VITVI
MMQRHHTQSEIHLGFFALIRRIITSSLPSSPVLTVELQKMKMEAHEDEMRSLCVTLKPPDLNLFPMRYLFYGLRFTHKLGCGSGRKCCLFQIRLLELMDCSLSFSRLTLFQIKGLLWANIKVCFQGVRATDGFTIWKSIWNGWPVFGRDTSNSFFEDATKVRFWLFGWRRDFKEVSLNPFVRVTSNVDWRMNVGDGLGIITSESWFLLAISRLQVRVG